MSKPIVAVVGRPNVGKSTLFNQIGEKRISIVDDMPGVTRDRIYMDAEWLNHEFIMIDTGGIEFDESDHILRSMRSQAELAIEEADVILFLVDGRAGLTSSDEEVARILRRTQKPVILAVNKIDSFDREALIYDFYALGLGDPIPISASNAMNLGDLLDMVVAAFPRAADADAESDEIAIAVVGRPNVGKSSLVNRLLGEDRVIVSDVPGTTRDAIDTHFTRDGVKYLLIDTAGMRRKGKITLPVERYSVMRSLRAIDRAGVVLMVINAAEGILEQDTKIAGYVHESGKGVIIVVNKWDKVLAKPWVDREKMMNRYIEYLKAKIEFLPWVSVVFTSALDKKRIDDILENAKNIKEERFKRVKTSVLNNFLEQVILKHPPTWNKKSHNPKIYYGSQVDVNPPKFVFTVNNPDHFHFSYKRYLENRIRDNFWFFWTPIILEYRWRGKYKDKVK